MVPGRSEADDRHAAGEEESVGYHPFVPASTVLSEITPKAVVLGILLSMVLASANVYLGLFAGITVSASIPAAVISMGILRLFPRRNILENNIVQTSTSAGESLAAGVIFTIPAMVILGVWDGFLDNLWETILIGAFAGILGVAFTIPLRRAFIVDAKLQYPEGIACAEVLEVGEEGGRGVKVIALGGLMGVLYKFANTGAELWRGAFDAATRAGDTLLYFGSNLSPALVGVGYIVGIRIAVLVFGGGVISWLIAMPIYTSMNGIPADLTSSAELVDFSFEVWSSQIRYLGVGAMAVGGLWALIQLRKPLMTGMRSGIDAYSHMKYQGADTRPRTEQDIDLRTVAIIAGVAAIPLFFIFTLFIDSILRSLLMTVVMLVAGFLFASVAAYMAGVVGSSNNPISGVTIATALVTGAILWLTGISDELGTVATIAVAATIASAAAIGGDNMQDLKTGYLVGSTPRKQQYMQIIGVTSAALVIPFTLELIHQSFGICTEASAPDGCLVAPQATLIGSVSGAFFGNPIPWLMAAVGAFIAIGIIALDEFQRIRGSDFRTPVLAVAVGIYLPLELSTAIFLGGMVHWAVTRHHRRRLIEVRADPSEDAEAAASVEADADKRAKTGLRDGLLLASGLIAGEAIMGILLGIPRLPVFAPDGGNPLAVFEGLPGQWPVSGLLVLGFVCYLLYYVGIRPFKVDVEPADPPEFEEV